GPSKAPLSFILRAMFSPKKLLKFFIIFVLATVPAFSQAEPSWKVKPEWVRAHEMFLSSDALRGRGSATPDELLAATYVASQFERFGIKPGLPDGTYIQ